MAGEGQQAPGAGGVPGARRRRRRMGRGETPETVVWGRGEKWNRKCIPVLLGTVWRTRNIITLSTGVLTGMREKRCGTREEGEQMQDDALWIRHCWW